MFELPLMLYSLFGSCVFLLDIIDEYDNSPYRQLKKHKIVTSEVIVVALK